MPRAVRGMATPTTRATATSVTASVSRVTKPLITPV